MANSFSFGMSSSSSSQSQAFPFYQLSSSSTFSFGSSPQLSFSSSSTPVASFSYPSFPLSSSSDTVSAIPSFSSMEPLAASSPFFFASSSSSISSSAPTSIPSFCSALGPGFHSAPAFRSGFGSGLSPSASPSLFASSTPFGASSSSLSLFSSSSPFGASSSSNPSLSASTLLFGASSFSSASSSSTCTPLFGASSSPLLFSSSASAASFSTSASVFGVSSSSSSSCTPLFGASSSSFSPLLSGTLAPTAASTTTDSSSTAASTPPFPSFPSSPVSFGFPKPSSPDARLVTSTMPAPASRPGFGLGIPAPTNPVSPLFISPSSIPSLSTTAATTSATPTSSNSSLFSSQPTAFPAASMPWVQLFSSALLSFSSSTSTAISTMTPAVTSTAEAKMTAAASTPSQFQSTSASLLSGCTFESPATCREAASTEGQTSVPKAPTPDSSAEEIKSEPSTPTSSLQDEQVSATPLDSSDQSPASASVSSTHVSTLQSIKSKLPGLLEDLTIEQVQAHLAEAESMGQDDLCYVLIDICALVEDLHSFRLEVPLTAHAELHKVQEAATQCEEEWMEIGQAIAATELEVSELEHALTQAKGMLLELKQRQSAIVPPDSQTIEKLRREARKEEALDRISRAKVAALEAEYEKLLLGLD